MCQRYLEGTPIQHPDGAVEHAWAQEDGTVSVLLRPPRVVEVQRSHVDDWLRHPGWWATVDQPAVRAGDRFAFHLGWEETLVWCQCLAVLPPGVEKEHGDFLDWWVTRYAREAVATEPEVVAARDHTGDAQRAEEEWRLRQLGEQLMALRPWQFLKRRRIQRAARRLRP